jgi:predicted RNA-binding protein associated with RNAse of E/G family
MTSTSHAAGVTVTEVKHHLRGNRDEYQVELLWRDSTLVLVRFVAKTVMKGDGVRFPAGAYTYGYFWDDRNYNIYRMHFPDGQLFAHRFDVLKDFRFDEDRFEWTDLLLDLWVYADGSTTWKDDDQVAAFLESGRMSPEDGALVAEVREILATTHDELIAEAGQILEQAPGDLTSWRPDVGG